MIYRGRSCSYKTFSHVLETQFKILTDLRKNMFACLFGVDNKISSSSYEQVCLKV